MGTRSIEDAVAVGVAVIDGDGRFVSVNRAGVAILAAAHPAELSSVQSPFEPPNTVAPRENRGAMDERFAYWDNGSEDYVVLAYQVGGAVGDGDVAVTFRDVTHERHQQRRVAALARTAASMASQRSVVTVLHAMAHEIQQSVGVAAVQIITAAPTTKRLQVMGAAGFSEVHTFFDLLMASHRRGASLATFAAMDSGRQRVYRHRRADMLADPTWEPMHAYISQIDWDDFVCTPLMNRGNAIGVLNVYMAPHYHAGHTMLEFFTAMADQASLAVDYAVLLERDRIAVRREERKRLARDLHDSVVQHVFAIGMQAGALQTIGPKLPAALAASVARIATEIGDLSKMVQRDLRGVVLALQPSMSAEVGLAAALQVLVDKVARRTQIRFGLAINAELIEDDADFVEDVYQVVSESVHNAVKHAAPSTISVTIDVIESPRTVRIDVIDDGTGVAAQSSTADGYGLTSMRDRVSRWSGQITVAADSSGRGTHVSATLIPPPPYPISEGRPHD